MKARMGLMAAMMVVATAGGCASMQKESGYVAPQGTPSLQDPDALYIATVERIAQRRGIEVVWVNPPTKRPAARTGDPRQAMR